LADSSSYTSLASVEMLNSVLVGYRVKRQIGHGAMGVVFEAEQERLGRQVAIKVLPSSLALRTRTVKRFLREASAMGRLSHENIVSVFEVGSIEDLHYFSMKYVEGPPLDRVLRAGPLAIADVTGIGIDVARALAHAHAHGVMHRDIKPGNLLRDHDRVVLTDFGLARPLDSEETGSMTESGDLVGTPLYMAPEQISGDAERIDGRADVWGLGVTLYELLTQRPPFPGANASGILNSILHKDPPLLRKMRDDVPRDLEAVILKCLEKDLSRRYSGAAALLADLEAVRDGRPISASPPRFYDPPLRCIRRHPVEAGLVGSALVVALLLGVAVQQRSRQLESTVIERDRANAAKQQAEVGRDAAVEARTASRVLYELSEARILWASGLASGSEELCAEAAERALDLFRSLGAVEDDNRNLDLMAECLRVIFGWLREKGDERLALEYLETLFRSDDHGVLRAAALAGLERYDQALSLHRERGRRDPLDPDPLLDAAGIVRQRALAAQASPRPNERTGYLIQALRLHAAAIDLAVRARDEEKLTTILVERARCLTDLGRFDQAIADLRRALEHDPGRVEASALLRTAERKRGEAEADRAARAARPRPTALTRAPFLDEVQDTIGLDLEELIEASPTLDREDLESAGRGLQSIYRGLSTLLRSAATPEQDEAPEGGPRF